MAITTLAQAISGLCPPHSYRDSSANGNNPGLQTAFFSGSDSTTIGGVAVSSSSSFSAYVKSSLSTLYTSPQSGQLAYLSGVSIKGSTPVSGSAYSDAGGMNLILCDVLWVCGVQSSGVAIAVDTSLQTINSNAWPARDNNGNIAGEGVYIGLVVTNNFSISGGNATISYTNSAGISGRTGVHLDLSAQLRDSAFSFFSLDTGDIGVKSIQTFQFSTAHTSGNVSLVAVRPVAMLPFIGQSVNTVDPISLCIPKLYNNSIIGYIASTPTSDHTVAYTLSVSQG